VDRGAHEAAIDNGWLVDGYMPRDARDERGPIPPDVARFLRAHAKTNYAARTEANVRSSNALLVVVRNSDDPRATPGTTRTIDLAVERHMRRMIVDPSFHARSIATWIWRDLLLLRTLPSPFETRPIAAWIWRDLRTLPLPFETRSLDPVTIRLMVAGPRESKWTGARVETAELLRRVALELREIKTAMTSDRRTV
jgi:hypothetical protein